MSVGVACGGCMWWLYVVVACGGCMWWLHVVFACGWCLIIISKPKDLGVGTVEGGVDRVTHGE